MDSLLMAHGWRRYRWDDILHPSPVSFAYPPEYKGAIISGKVVDSHTGTAPATLVQVYLSVPRQGAIHFGPQR